MSVLRTFSKSEDANLCAAYLASCGIDTTLVEENGYGGNLLGATVANAIHIEVPESSLEAAREHLVAYLQQTANPERGEPEKCIEPRSGTESRYFNWAVTIFIILEVSTWLGRDWLCPEVPQAVVDFITSSGVVKPIWRLAYAAADGLLILGLAACFMCLKRWSVGRTLFATVAVLDLITMSGAPPRFGIPLAYCIGAAQWLLTGVIWFMMYRTPLRREFDRS